MELDVWVLVVDRPAALCQELWHFTALSEEKGKSKKSADLDSSKHATC